MKIGLVGLGHHGLNAVMPALRLNGDIQLVAVADPNTQQLAKAADPAIARYESASDLFKQADVDAVYIATLSSTHAELAIEALHHGKHVICEKPMADTVAQCQAMLDAAEQARRHLVVNFETRFYHHHRLLRQWVMQGRLGQIQAIHLTNFWDGHKSFGDIAPRRARLMNLAGALDCGIHKLDLARFLTGAGQWTRIAAAGAWMGESFQFPPHLAILGTLDTGVMATINASLSYASHIEPRPMLEILSLAGTQGVASYCVHADDPAAFNQTREELRLYSRDGIERVPVNHDNGHAVTIARLLSLFAPVVHGQTTIQDAIAQGLPTGYDGLQAQVATELAHADALHHNPPPEAESLQAPAVACSAVK